MHESDLKARPRFGTLWYGIYTFRGGIFRTDLPEFTSDIQDSRNGVFFTDMAGGFWMIEFYEIPQDLLSITEPDRLRQFLKAGMEQMLIPKRITPAFGKPRINEIRFLDEPEDPTCYVDGIIEGGSSYTAFAPDGTCRQTDLRFGLLALVKGRSVFAFMRTANTLAGYEGDHDYPGIQGKLVSFAKAVEYDVDENEAVAKGRQQEKPEQQRRDEEQREKALELRRQIAERIQTAIARFGMACPHCSVLTKNVKYCEDDACFVCRECGRSFAPEDLKDSDIYARSLRAPSDEE